MQADLTSEINVLSSYTVEKLKAWSKERGIKIPSGLKKSTLLQYLSGVLQENGATKRNIAGPLDISKLSYRTVDNTTDWVTLLYTQGWTIVPIPGWDHTIVPGKIPYSQFTHTFLTWFESCNANFNKYDRSTWIKNNLPVMPYGIVKHYLGHTEFQWKIRELCAPIFSKLWQCAPEELLCSYDGGCLTLPVSNVGSLKQWIHVDQMRMAPTFCCAQGIVNFEDNGVEDGGLILLEGSHQIFKSYMGRHSSEGISWSLADMDDQELSHCPMLKICAPAGSLILFDSRMFHCNMPPYGSVTKENGVPRYRMCTYVSMQPRSGATSAELSKRIKLYEAGRMTGHWCYGHYFQGTAKDAHTYGAPNNHPSNIEIAQLNPLRARLIGYD